MSQAHPQHPARPADQSSPTSPRAGEPAPTSSLCPGPPYCHVSAPTFTRDTLTGAVTVDGWTDHVAVSHDLLAEAPAEFLVSDGQTIQIRAANGHATYRVTGIFPGEVHGDLVACEGPRKA